MPTFLDIFLKKALFKRVFEISTSEKKKNNKRKKQLKKRPSPFSVITQQKMTEKGRFFFGQNWMDYVDYSVAILVSRFLRKLENVPKMSLSAITALSVSFW